jgi:hypothetical protein
VLEELAGSQARGVLPWVQRDFGGVREFRREFARDWLRAIGEQFATVQRTNLPRPGQEPDRRWVEAIYRIDNFEIFQPTSSANLRFGSFRDKDLARLLLTETKLAREVPDAERGVDAQSGIIDVAMLLGLGGGEISVTAGNWYEARGDFEARVVDPLG